MSIYAFSYNFFASVLLLDYLTIIIEKLKSTYYE